MRKKCKITYEENHQFPAVQPRSCAVGAVCSLSGAGIPPRCDGERHLSRRGRSLSLHFPPHFTDTRHKRGDPTTSTANLDLSVPTYRADATTHATSAANPAANAAKAGTNAQTSATSSQNSAQLPPTDAPSKTQTVLHFTVTRQDTNETLIGAAVRCQGVLAVTDTKGNAPSV